MSEGRAERARYTWLLALSLLAAIGPRPVIGASDPEAVRAEGAREQPAEAEGGGQAGGGTGPPAQYGLRRARGSLAPELVVGARVEVKGSFLPDGAFLADEIELKHEADTDEELRGVIESVDPGAKRITVLGFTVEVGPGTSLSREPSGPARLEDLTAGLRVKVDGQRGPQGSFIAESVKIRQNQYAERKFVGAIERIDPSIGDAAVVHVLGLRVVVNGATDLLGSEANQRAFLVPQRPGPDDGDLLFTGLNRLGAHVVLSGEVRMRAKVVSNPDLDVATDDDVSNPEFHGVFGMAAQFGPVFMLGEVTGERDYFLRGGGQLTSEPENRSSLYGSQAFVEYRGLIVPQLTLSVGRRKFDDEREWYYNSKVLDAVLLRADLNVLTVEGSVSRDLFDETRNKRDQELANVIVHARARPTPDLAVEGFYVRRKDRTGHRNSPRIVGARILGSPGRHLEFWADLARESGTREEKITLVSEDAPPRRMSPTLPIEAYAVDVGATFRPRILLDPSFTASFALGSGDNSFDAPVSELPGGSDHGFRQSGLERNRDSWNGTVSFRYYGEVLNPELTNLRILTLGAAIRPLRSFSVDLVYHRYRQDVSSSRLVNTDLDAKPSGRDPDLGTEWDLAIGFEPNRTIELRVTGGRLFPGKAFEGADSDAQVLIFQTKLRF